MYELGSLGVNRALTFWSCATHLQELNFWYMSQVKNELGWDDLGEWHWNMYIIICVMNCQSRFDAWDRVLGAGALGWPRGMGWGGRWEGGSGWETHVHLWWICVNSMGKPLLLLLSHFSRVRLLRSHRWQPTRLPRPWDSPGKNTGVGCHFLLQCMKVKSESEVAQSILLFATPWTAAYQAPLSMGFSRQEYWSGVPLPSPMAKPLQYCKVISLQVK